MPLTSQFTAGLLLLITVAVNCCVDPCCTFIVAGVTTTAGLLLWLPPLPQADSIAIPPTATAVRTTLLITGPHFSRVIPCRTEDSRSPIRGYPRAGIRLLAGQPE